MEPQLILSLTAGNASDPIAVVTPDQADEIEQLMSSREVVTILQAWCIVKLTTSDSIADGATSAEFARAFETIVGSWCEQRNLVWKSLARDLWRLADDSLSTMLSTIRLTREDQEALRSYTKLPAAIPGQNQRLPLFLRELMNVLGDPSLLEKARDLTNDIREIAYDLYSEIRLDHAPEEHRFDYEQLYISRSLVNYHTNQSAASDILLPFGGVRPRHVVIGDPGVGKSTLVQHVVYNISRSSETPISEMAPLVLKCREYGSGARLSLVRAICGRLAIDHQITVTEVDLTSLFALGRAYVIFDGIDEITDLTIRRDFVRTIEVFAARYPLVPILATCRRIGYERASLRPRDFVTWELSEFSDDQVDEYVTRWFQAKDRPAIDRAAFLRESTTIDEVRRNPLMLSLLCALYRARGYIPQNRRQVYRDCAELLFVRWDSMRHIEQPFDHKQFGQRLMQELALFFYRSQRAQAGIEEGQLVRIVTAFFVDAAGVDVTEAEQRSRSFLDFCADRAWLLTGKGTSDRGQRLFGFTHRTFMEYFAAEALVRRTPRIEDIVEEVAKIYVKDPSSVLPDVIVQCVDDRSDRGAQDVIEGILERGRKVRQDPDKFLTLCIRILNTAPVGGYLTEKLVDQLFAAWMATPADSSLNSAKAVFELYRDPRTRVGRKLSDEIEKLPPSKRQQADLKRSETICERWSRLYLLDQTVAYETDWLSLLDHSFRELAARRRLTDPALTNYLLERYRVSPRVAFRFVPIEVSLAMKVAETPVLGTLMRGYRDELLRPDEGLDTDLESTTLGWFIREKVQRFRLKWNTGHLLDEALSSQVAYWPPLHGRGLIDRIRSNEVLMTMSLWLACLLYEVNSPVLHPLHVTLGPLFGEDFFERIAVTRDRLDDEGAHREARSYAPPLPLADQEIERLRAEYGLWVGRWLEGASLLQASV
ncbi:MAG TPA: NACHT domain-containing protein [Mycobacteriales bacterium]|nr:NACHT domain-containing protein [Mycobacteriales bacterium]